MTDLGVTFDKKSSHLKSMTTKEERGGGRREGGVRGWEGRSKKNLSTKRVLVRDYLGLTLRGKVSDKGPLGQTRVIMVLTWIFHPIVYTKTST